MKPLKCDGCKKKRKQTRRIVVDRDEEVTLCVRCFWKRFPFGIAEVGSYEGDKYISPSMRNNHG